MSLAEDIAAEIGPEPSKRAAPERSRFRELHPAWDLANGVDIIRVLDWLGIEHDDKFAKCPGCGEEGAKICDNGGIKCLHARCSGAGPGKNPGFRTNIDLAACVHGGALFENATHICDQFGISYPKPHRSSPRQDDDYIPEPPEGWTDEPEEFSREPGADEGEAYTPSAAKPAPSDVRLLTYRDLLTTSAERALKRERVSVCTTGHYKLDDVTGGFKPGFVWVFGADSSWGKSSLLVMLADENIKRNKRVLIVSGEDDETLYGDRLLVRRSGVPYREFQRRQLNKDQRDIVQATVRRAEPLPVFLDGRGRSIEKICTQLERIITSEEIDLVALDYVQALNNDKKQQDKRNEITYIARKFTDTVKTAGKSGIIFSQITKNEQNAKRYPDKHSIRDSRDVSNAAEVIVLGFEPDKRIDNPDGTLRVAAGQKCVLVDKCKDGPRGGIFGMLWDTDVACFKTVRDPETVRLEQMAGDFSDLDARAP